MAIARDTTGTRNNSGATTTPSNTFNNAAGNFLTVGFFYDKNATVSLAQYNGVTMTNSQTVTMTGWVYKLSIWYLVSPATGSHTVNFTLSVSAAATIIIPQSYSGVDTSSPVDSSAQNYLTGTAGGATQTITLSPTTSTGWMVGYCVSSGSGLSGGTNTNIISGGTTQDALYDTNGTIASGSQTLNIVWTGLNSSEGAGMVGFSFKAPTVASTNGFFRLMRSR